MGSSYSDGGNAIAVDGSGNVYVAGSSAATWGSPVNAHVSNDYSDAFAAKLDSSGSLQWNTFMGAAGQDLGSAIAVDGSGNVYVAGSSDATWGTPVNNGPKAGSWKYDAFAAKLDSSGSLKWNTFMGAHKGTYRDDYGFAIAVDGSGNVYVAGDSSKTWGSPVNAHEGGLGDAFAAMLNSSGYLQWNTFMGSSSYDTGDAIAVDGSGNVYVAGTSSATWGSPENDHTGTVDAFAAKLDSSSGYLQWNTFMEASGSGYHRSAAIAVDGSENVYVAGTINATLGTLPVNEYDWDYDAFAAKIVPDSYSGCDGDGCDGDGGVGDGGVSEGGCFIATTAR